MRNRNLLFTDVDAKDGEEFIDCNLAQKKAHTKLKCFGSKVKFVNCNLTNVELWPEAEVINCLTVHADIVEVVEMTDVQYLNAKFEELSKEFGVGLIKQVVSSKFDLVAKKVVSNDNIR